MVSRLGRLMSHIGTILELHRSKYMPHELSTCNKYKDCMCLTCWLRTCATGSRRPSVREDLEYRPIPCTAGRLVVEAIQPVSGRREGSFKCSAATASGPFCLVCELLSREVRHELRGKSRPTAVRRCTIDLD